jgi:hypothetical protein
MKMRTDIDGVTGATVNGAAGFVYYDSRTRGVAGYIIHSSVYLQVETSALARAAIVWA